MSAVPSLAGLCTIEEATREGLPVDECVAPPEALPLRLQAAARHLHRAHHRRAALRAQDGVQLPRLPLRRARGGAADARRRDARAAARPRRGAARGARAVLRRDPGRARRRRRCSPDSTAGRCRRSPPRSTRYQAETNPLADAPSRRVCRFAAARTRRHARVRRGRASRRCPAATMPARRTRGSRRSTSASPPPAGSTGRGRADGTPPPRQYSQRPYVYDPVPRRDERFPDPYNMGVNAEAFLYDETKPAPPKVLMMFYKRLREIDVPEMMASIIAETPGKPWGYYRDMSRQLWDEARHAMMGEVGFVALGVDWPALVRINFTWSLGLNTQLTPIERHAVLYFIEQGLMPKTGKRYEWEVGRPDRPAARRARSRTSTGPTRCCTRASAGSGTSRRCPRTSRRSSTATAAGRRCSPTGTRWRASGLTAHENWWPALYRAFCASRGETPDPGRRAIRRELQDESGGPEAGRGVAG